MTTTKMPFGKFKGKALNNIPKVYLQWLVTRDIDDHLRSAIQDLLTDYDRLAVIRREEHQDRQRRYAAL